MPSSLVKTGELRHTRYRLNLPASIVSSWEPTQKNEIALPIPIFFLDFHLNLMYNQLKNAKLAFDHYQLKRAFSFCNMLAKKKVHE